MYGNLWSLPQCHLLLPKKRDHEAALSRNFRLYKTTLSRGGGHWGEFHESWQRVLHLRDVFFSGTEFFGFFQFESQEIGLIPLHMAHRCQLVFILMSYEV